jgi:hypothetical protein
LLDFDAALLINRGFPLAIISQLARNQQLPENLRREILIAAWVRAILLDKEDIAQELTPQLLKSEPRLQSLLQGYLKAKTIAERRFAAIFALLQYPVMQPSVDANLPRTTAFNEIDSYRDNWWCKFNLELPSTQEVEGSFSPNAANARNLLPVAFLTTTERQQAVAEFKQLTTLETAPNYFCQQVLAWAKLSPKDPRVPEALHLAVRATRYGCTDEQTLRASKAAFQWLHKYYPTSPWTKKTPYFFGN